MAIEAKISWAYLIDRFIILEVDLVGKIQRKGPRFKAYLRIIAAFFFPYLHGIKLEREAPRYFK